MMLLKHNVPVQSTAQGARRFPLTCLAMPKLNAFGWIPVGRRQQSGNYTLGIIQYAFHDPRWGSGPRSCAPRILVQGMRIPLERVGLSCSW